MKWTAPLDCSGLPVEYVVQMTPPSKGDANAAAPLTSDVSFCRIKPWCFGKSAIFYLA